MIQKLAEHRIPFLLLIILLLVQSFSINLNDPYRKPINGDAQAYYAYLPALFIYQDLDYTFVPEMQQKYYVEASSKSFLKEVDGEKVNKTFPGVTLLYAPFFFLAHGTSLLLGLPADGYAYTYQLFYLAGFWFYVLLGMIFFRKILVHLQFSERIAHLSLITLVFGSNIFFFTIYDQSVTHLYSFFLINLACYLLLKLHKAWRTDATCRVPPQQMALLLALITLIGITRPTNILVLGLFLFFIPDLSFYKYLFRELFRIKTVFKTILPAVLVLAIPFILWKLQTDHWIVYSYGEEGFQFLHPELWNFLFSYTKGWFLYTPIMLLILLGGFMILWWQNKKQAFTGIVFLALCIYVYSSWWCWYYGAGMSQRVMIDFYILPGFLLALIFQKMAIAMAGRTSFLGPPLSMTFTIAILIAMNMAQAWQISNGILPFGSPTEQQYWDNFLVMQKRAQVYPQDHWAFVSKGSVSLNPADGQILKDNPVQIEEDWCLQVNPYSEYSAVAQIPSQHFKKGCKLIVSFEARALSAVEQTRVVFQTGPDFQSVFFLKEYVSNDWEKMQYLVEINAEMTTAVDIYLWSAGSGEQVDLRKLSWELYFNETYF
jgi:hypothetical protein